MQQKKKRIHFLDQYRGLAVILMVAYHAWFDLNELFGVETALFHSPYARWLVYFIGGSFITVSGISCVLSHSNRKRGILCLGCALMLSVVTAVAIPSQVIRFGILHLLGCSILLYGLGEALWRKMSPLWSGGISLALFFLTFPIPRGYLGLGDWVLLPLPSSLYTIGWLYPVGMPAPTFFSGDYYPLLPWGFLFFGAAFLGRWILQRPLPAFCYRQQLPLLAWIGQHSMVIYLLHQPLVYGVLWLLFR